MPTDAPGIFPTREPTYATTEPTYGTLVGSPLGILDGVEVSPGLPADYWARLVSKFIDGHDPSNIVQFAFAKYFEADQPGEVTVHLRDPRLV